MRRRRWVSLMLAGTMAASLAGCSGSSDAAKDQEPAKTEKSAEAGSEKKEEAADSGEKTVVTVWTQDRHDSEYVESKIEEFNNTNDKGIEIALNVITDDYANMMSLAYSSGTAPDIAGIGAAFSNFDLKTFADAGHGPQSVRCSGTGRALGNHGAGGIHHLQASGHCGFDRRRKLCTGRLRLCHADCGQGNESGGSPVYSHPGRNGGGFCDRHPSHGI